jgi:hypothetical protein
MAWAPSTSCPAVFSSALTASAADSTNAPGVVAAEADLGDIFEVAIAEFEASLAADAQQGILKARGIVAGKELLWVGRIAFTSKRSGQGQLKIERAVVAADRPVTASRRSDFCGVESVRDLCFSFVAPSGRWDLSRRTQRVK